MKYPKTVVITGANGQTAVHLAKELLRNDATLILLIHNRAERIEKLKTEYGDRCVIVPCDLNDFNQTHNTLQTIFTNSHLYPDALIHTAAIRSYDAKVLHESEPQIWNNIINQNIGMAYNILRCILPGMTNRRNGKVVMFGSNVTRTGLPSGSAYAAAKAAIANLVRTVAWETAAYNVQINMISPAPIETNLEEDYEGLYLNFRKEYFEAYKKSHPANKLVCMNDINQMVLTLLNGEINSISGEEIFLTGGVL